MAHLCDNDGFFIAPAPMYESYKKTYKNKRRGRLSKNAPVEQVAVVEDNFRVDLQFDREAFDGELAKCGYCPLLTNQPADRLGIEEAMKVHKGQYKSEHIYRRAKGPFSIEPIYLHTPERIEAYLLLFKIALQMVVLIERTARNNISE